MKKVICIEKISNRSPKEGEECAVIKIEYVLGQKMYKLYGYVGQLFQAKCFKEIEKK